MNCERCRELLLEGMGWMEPPPDPAEAAEVEQHVASCPACAQERETWARVSSSLRAEDEAPDALIMEALWAQVQRSAASAAPPRPPQPSWELLTLEELARSLRMTPEWVEANLDDIPHLYLGGLVRFRRARIAAWLEQKEAAQQRLRRRIEELRPHEEAAGTWALAGSLPLTA